MTATMVRTATEQESTTRAEALFASSLQPSDHPTRCQAEFTIFTTLATKGPDGCAAIMATEFGDHPEAAAARMRWALALAS